MSINDVQLSNLKSTIDNLKSSVDALERRLDEVIKMKGIAGPPGPQGRPGNIDAAVAQAVANVQALEGEIKATASSAVNEISAAAASARESYYDTKAVADSIRANLKATDERLSTNDYLETLVLDVLEQYQLIKDGGVGDLIKHFVNEAIEASKQS
jgi:uncharacterized protein (UPF0335 family)